jgi:hypothetical protein
MMSGGALRQERLSECHNQMQQMRLLILWPLQLLKHVLRCFQTKVAALLRPHVEGSFVKHRGWGLAASKLNRTGTGLAVQPI